MSLFPPPCKIDYSFNFLEKELAAIMTVNVIYPVCSIA